MSVDSERTMRVRGEKTRVTESWMAYKSIKELEKMKMANISLSNYGIVLRLFIDIRPVLNSAIFKE